MYFSDGGHGADYWRYCFPAFSEYCILHPNAVIGGAGGIFMFMSAGVNLVMNCPPEMSGVAGAWNQVVAQTGTTVALAIQAGLEDKDVRKWRTNARSFWYEAAAFGAVALVYVVCYQKPGERAEEHAAARERIRLALEKREQRENSKK